MYFPEVRFLEKNQQGAKVQMEAGKINKKRQQNTYQKGYVSMLPFPET